MRSLGVLVVCACLLAACGGSTDGPDAGAQLACEKYRKAAGDYTDGVLTMSELRGRFQDVHKSARGSNEPGMEATATAVLAASTADDLVALAVAVDKMNQLCDGLGL